MLWPILDVSKILKNRCIFKVKVILSKFWYQQELTLWKANLKTKSWLFVFSPNSWLAIRFDQNYIDICLTPGYNNRFLVLEQFKKFFLFLVKGANCLDCDSFMCVTHQYRSSIRCSKRHRHVQPSSKVYFLYWLHKNKIYVHLRGTSPKTNL